MKRERLRLTLAYAILKHNSGGLKISTVKRNLNRDLLKIYGIRKNTEITVADWNTAIEFAKLLYKDKLNTFSTIRKMKDCPHYQVINELFKTS